MSIRSYKDLEVWQKSLELVAECYQLSRSLPVKERFVLVTQLHRAAISVAANIAEGHERRGTREFLRHLSIARGSLAELETLLAIAERLRHASVAQLLAARRLADDVGRMLSRLRQSLSARSPRLPSPAPRP